MNQSPKGLFYDVHDYFHDDFHYRLWKMLGMEPSGRGLNTAEKLKYMPIYKSSIVRSCGILSDSILKMEKSNIEL